jgi:hypothetical protein
LPIAPDWLFLQIIIYSAEIFQNIKEGFADTVVNSIGIIWPASFIAGTNLAGEKSGQ